MKKITVCILTFILIILSGCSAHNSDEKQLIYYNGKYYDSVISEDYTYNSFWYPLSAADITDKAYFCTRNTNTAKLGKKDETEIKKFSDKKLSMFILMTDSWGEWLCLDTEYSLPSVSAENIEKIVIKKNSEEKWADYYKNDSCISIQDNSKINAVVEKLNEMEDLSGIKSYELNDVENSSGMCIKFKDINALYYVGLISEIDGNTVFYNAHKKQSSFYVMFEKNTDNPFNV